MQQMHQSVIEQRTGGRGTTDITGQVARAVEHSGCQLGMAQLFIHHTSASLIICENADPDVHRDLEAWLARAVVDGDPLFRHRAEGPDDMSAHIRSVLTATSLSLPITDGRLALGTWQGIYLYEHRTAPHRRRITITIIGQ